MDTDTTLTATRNIFEQYQALEQEFSAFIGPVRYSSQINLRLERVTHLLALLGNPQNAYPSIHVGGTSGKGSTATFAATILAQAGYKTGLHISPHLQILNERHQINNQVIPTSRLAALFAAIKPAIATVAAENAFGMPSYFEVQAALAFYYFQQEAVDVAVIEVGLGGRIDATNVINASVAVLTNVGLDHTAVLGDTIEQIIQDKAGIIKPGQTVISGVHQASARQIVAERCREKQARLWQMGHSFYYNTRQADCLDLFLPEYRYEQLKLGMPGDFQIANAACAVAALHGLSGFIIPEAAIRNGLLRAKIPGRMEFMQDNPIVILDGAHNPEKMRASRRLIHTEFSHKDVTVILSLKSDKAAEDVLPDAIDGAKQLILTEFRPKGLWKPISPEVLAQLASKLNPTLDIQIIPNPSLAFEQAVAQADRNTLVWVTGSLYLVGDIREYWYPIPQLVAQAEVGLPGTLVIP